MAVSVALLEGDGKERRTLSEAAQNASDQLSNKQSATRNFHVKTQLEEQSSVNFCCKSEASQSQNTFMSALYIMAWLIPV